jgi:hypothetical protein
MTSTLFKKISDDRLGSSKNSPPCFKARRFF